MADNFFGFDTDFPSGLGVLGRPDLDDELLTDDVEEEYDALNDETFGQAANDDWEEAHEKLSELIKNNNIDLKSYFNDSLLENDDSQQEIVSQSISQLGLEDDLDDPAIMTISRSCPSTSRLRSVFGPSPPPPAILETEICGSPKTHSIWSTTPKDSGISFLQSLSHSSLSHKEPHVSSDSTSDNVFISPHKAWHAEELERNLLSSSDREKQTHASSSKWPSTSTISSSSQNLSNKSPQRFPNLNNNQNKVNQRMLTREEVERHIHSDLRVGFQNKVGTFSQTPIPPHLMRPNMMPPIGPPTSNNLNASFHSSPVVPVRLRAPIIGGSLERPYVPFPNNVHPHSIHQMPRSDYMLHNHQMRNMLSQYLGLASRPITHPLMHPQFKPFMMVDKHEAENHRNGMQNVDEYAGLMSQKEKEWLIRIQMLLLKSENPYIEDYYYTTQQARKLKKIYSENSKKNKGEAPEIILPETSKLENKIYVPTQFEGSLGKLQAVSVNFPRRVLDIKVARLLEDDEGRVVTNQCLMKYRRLLLDIEKLYSYFLEKEDEEKRILAKPDSGEAPHRINIAKLTAKIYNGFCSENSPEENFQNIMTIRKGRNLLMRSFSLFSKEQQLQCLIYLCKCLLVILKKDQNDLILVKNYEIITDAIQSCSLSDLVQLGEALENGSSVESSKERNNFAAALKNKFGSSVICCMLNRAENLYSGYDLFETDIQTRWAKTMLYLVDILCNTENASLSLPLMPSSGLLCHFQRFAVDRDKFEILKEKLNILETNCTQESLNAV